MQWRGRRGSSNIEDRRGGGMRKAGGGLGIGAIVLFVASIFFPQYVPLLQMVGVGGGGAGLTGGGGSSYSQGTGVDDDHSQFLGVVLADTEDVWSTIFRENGTRYQEPTLVIFDGRTTSPCGPASTGSGPFYCPADKKIYIDPGFYDVMERRLGAPGDFAQAYVIAHEVAHHVQNVEGIIPKVTQYKRTASKVEQNRATVRLELQADCYSGVWTNRVQRSKGVLEEGDVKEALNAAFAIGDDTLQGRSGGHVDPATFTHGTSQQRVDWFFRGLNSGDIATCDTFSQDYGRL